MKSKRIAAKNPRGELDLKTPVRARLRFDYRGEPKSRRFIFGSEDPAQAAEKVRERQVEILRNMPFQGLELESIEDGNEIYRLTSDVPNEGAVAYAPIELTVTADSIEDLAQLTMKKEFRCIKILEPEQIELTQYDVERMLYRLSEQNRQAGLNNQDFQ